MRVGWVRMTVDLDLDKKYASGSYFFGEYQSTEREGGGRDKE
jgi:hypothetical protein